MISSSYYTVLAWVEPVGSCSVLQGYRPENRFHADIVVSEALFFWEEPGLEIFGGRNVEFRLKEIQGKPLVEVDGSLDRDSVLQIRKPLLKVARRKEVRELTIDLSKVSRMDTSGIAVLVEVLRVISAKGGKLHLANVSETASRMIHLAGMEKAFDQPAG